jgi:uncharacterized protein YqeY
MTTQERITEDIKKAMKEKDAKRLETLRMVSAAVRNLEIEHKGGSLSDQEVVGLIRKEVKKRKESIEVYRGAGRDDLADNEETELHILEEYLPAQMSEEAIEQVVREIIDGGATSFGDVMKQAVAKTNGRADAKLISEIVKREL